MYRLRLFVAAVLFTSSIFVLAPMSALGQSDPDVWEGSIVIGNTSDGNEGDECEVRLGWFQVGNEVHLVDADDEIVATSTLQAGTLTDQGGCEFAMTFDEVDLDTTYSIAIPPPRGFSTATIEGFIAPGRMVLDEYFSEDVTVAADQEPTPLGETRTTDEWSIIVDEVEFWEAEGLEYHVVVFMTVVHEGDEPRGFGKPDMDMELRSSDNWHGRYDYFATSPLAVGLDYWTRNFTPGIEYEAVWVFAVQPVDHRAYPDGMSGWKMIVEDGDGTFEFELEDELGE